MNSIQTNLTSPSSTLDARQQAIVPIGAFAAVGDLAERVDAETARRAREVLARHLASLSGAKP